MKTETKIPQFKWIKAKSGNTYICPANIDRDLPESEMKKVCVDESSNPQND